MRLVISTLLFLLCASAFSQTNLTTSLSGIGDVKVGMKKAELEKLLNTSIKLKNLLKKESDRDTLNINYRWYWTRIMLKTTKLIL